MLGRKVSRRKDRRQAAGHGYEGGAVPAFDYGGIKEKAGQSELLPLVRPGAALEGLMPVTGAADCASARAAMVFG